MKKEIIFYAMGLVALASCSSDNATPTVANSNAISVTAQVKQAETRTPFLNDPSLTNTLTADILIASNVDDFTALYNAGGTVASFTSSSGPGLATACMWPAVETDNLYFVGLAPSDGAYKWGAPTATTSAITADGFHDLMTTGAAAAHFKSEASGKAPLTFSHAQVLVKLYVRAEDATASGDWGQLNAGATISKVNFTDQDGANDVDIPEVVTATLKDGSFVATSAADAPFSFWTIDATNVQEKYTDVAAPAIASIAYNKEMPYGYVMLPISSTGALKSLVLNLTSANPTVGTRTARIDMSSVTKGQACSIHLTLKQNGRISFSPVTVTEWGVVTETTGEIGG